MAQNLFYKHFIHFIFFLPHLQPKKGKQPQSCLHWGVVFVDIHQITTGFTCDVWLKKVFGKIGTGLTYEIAVFEDTTFSKNRDIVYLLRSSLFSVKYSTC